MGITNFICFIWKIFIVTYSGELVCRVWVAHGCNSAHTLQGPVLAAFSPGFGRQWSSFPPTSLSFAVFTDGLFATVHFLILCVFFFLSVHLHVLPFPACHQIWMYLVLRLKSSIISSPLTSLLISWSKFLHTWWNFSLRLKLSNPELTYFPLCSLTFFCQGCYPMYSGSNEFS